MDWSITVLLSLPALIMGLLSVKGYTQNRELKIWLTIGLLCVAYIFFFVHGRPFFHLFFIGLLWGILNSTIQVIFYPTYIANNPNAAKGYSKLSKKQNPRLVMLFIGLATGAATGLVFGAISWIAKKLFFNM
jgi:hypothetical protein